MNITIEDAKKELENNTKRYRDQLLRITQSSINELEDLKRRLENGARLPDGNAMTSATRLESTYQRVVSTQDALDIVSEITP
jgi:hypothetical protein